MSNVVQLPVTERKRSNNNKFRFTREGLRKRTATLDAEGATNITLRDDVEVGLILRKQRANWVVAYERHINGKTHRRTISPYDPDKFNLAYARAESARIRTGIEDGTLVNRSEQRETSGKTRELNRMTVGEAIDMHKKENAAMRETTITTYRRQLKSAFGLDSLMRDISKATIEAWYDPAIEQGRKPTGLRTTFASGKAIWNTWPAAFPKETRPEVNPFKEFAGRGSKRLQKATYRQGALPKEKTAAFITTAIEGMKEGGRGSNGYAAIAFMALTGLRARSIRELTWDRIRAHAVYIPGEGMKYTRDFVRPITPLMREILDYQRNNNEGDLVFSGKSAVGGLSNLQSPIDRLCKAVDTDHISPHDLRRTYASAATRAGTPEVAKKTLMAHATTDITEKYSVVRAELPAYALGVEEELMRVHEGAEVATNDWWEA